MEDREDSNPDDLLDRAVDSVLRGPIPDELPPDRVAQLAAVVRHAADQPYPITLAKRIRSMKPMTKIAVVAAVLIASVGLTSWLVPGRGEALAFVNVAEALTNVQSARWKTTRVVKRPQGEAETVQEIGMFKAPSRERTETAIPGGQTIAILEGRKAIFLSTPTKQATVMNVKINIEGFPEEEGLFGRTFLSLRQRVVRAQSGQERKAEPLGVKVIDGRRAVGFRMRHGHGETKIWADPKTSLPIRVEHAYSGETEIHIVMTDFEIDPDLDESLFSLDVPEGYTVNKLQLDTPKTPLVFLAKMLGMAAELNDGVFPPALRGEQGLVAAGPRLMREYFEKKFGTNQAEMAQKGSDMADVLKEVANLSMTFAGASALLQNLSSKHDWHYAGKDVKLNTPNRPIFWMKLPKKAKKGGKYQVIYADLSVKDVEPEDVPNVPESESSPKQ